MNRRMQQTWIQTLFGLNDHSMHATLYSPFPHLSALPSLHPPTPYLELPITVHVFGLWEEVRVSGRNLQAQGEYASCQYLFIFMFSPNKWHISSRLMCHLFGLGEGAAWLESVQVEGYIKCSWLAVNSLDYTRFSQGFKVTSN